MAVTSGYFDSVNDDRLYNAEQMTTYFRGLVSDGVFADVGDGLQVVAGTGLSVQVKPGRAVVNCRWVENDDYFSVNLTNSSSQLNRWTAVILRLDYSGREIVITSKDGTPATTPEKPTMTRNDIYYELCLAYVYVAKGATSILQKDITDTRANSNICGWVTGLIKQVDTSDLFVQWQSAYEDFYNSFISWFDTLTSQLQVNTYIQAYDKTITGNQPEDFLGISLDMQGYTFDASDIFEVYINGLRAYPDEYVVNNGTISVTVGESATASNVLVHVVKSKIGDPVSGGGTYFEPYNITERDASTSQITVTETE